MYIYIKMVTKGRAWLIHESFPQIFLNNEMIRAHSLPCFFIRINKSITSVTMCYPNSACYWYKGERYIFIKQLSCKLPSWNSIEISKREALQGSSFSLLSLSFSGHMLLESFWQFMIIESEFIYLSKKTLLSIVISKIFS